MHSPWITAPNARRLPFDGHRGFTMVIVLAVIVVPIAVFLNRVQARRRGNFAFP